MKNKYTLLALFFSCISIFANGQANWQWATGPTTTDSGEVFTYGMYTDAEGNSYVTGNFNGTLTFGTSTITSNASTLNEFLFIAKYNAQGTPVWAKSYGDTTLAYGTTLCQGPHGGVYVTGGFSGTLILGGTTMYGSAYGGGTFIARLDSLGNILWARGARCGSWGGASAVCTDAGGNVYLTGGYGGDSATFDSYTLPAAANENFYLVKFDSSGNAQWATTTGGDYYAQGQTLFTDAGNNVYVQGGFTDSVLSFGNITLTTTSVNGGYANLFVVKYDAAGNVLWAKSNQAAGSTVTGAIAYNGGGDFYFTGSYAGSFSLGTNTVTGPLNGDADMFLAEMDTAGNVVFIKNEADVVSTDEPFGAVVLSNGNVCVSSIFIAAQMIVGNDTLISPQGSDQFFAAAFDPAGNPVWAIGAASTFGTEGYGIGTDAASNVFVTGYYYSGGADLQLGNSAVPGSYGDNMFIGRIDYTPAGIQQVQGTTATINVYPNPSDGRYWFTGLQSGNTLEVYDILGHLVISTQTAASNYTLDLSGHTKGIYMYRITDADGLIQQGKIALQ